MYTMFMNSLFSERDRHILTRHKRDRHILTRHKAKKVLTQELRVKSAGNLSTSFPSVLTTV